MFALNGTLYRICTWIYHFAYLNLLFLLTCIPVITIFPATAAMFGLVRKWINGDEPPIFTTFYKLFAENFKQSLLAGLILTVIGLFLAEDYYLLSHIHTSFNAFILVSLTLVSLCYISSLLHVFPLMVHGHFTTKQLLINSFKLGIYRFQYTLINLITVAALLIISLKFSFLLFFFFSSVSAYLTYWYVNRKFMRIWKTPETSDTDPIAEPAVE